MHSTHTIALMATALTCSATLAETPDRALLTLTPPAADGQVDSVLKHAVTAGTLRPEAGHTVSSGSKSVAWTAVTPDDFGRISAPAGAWLAYQVNAPGHGPAMLTASGHDLTLVNGAPRAGMAEAPGVHKMPITLQTGRNDILVRATGGPVTLEVTPLEGDDLVFISPYDVTLPHVLDLQPVDEVGAILVINASDTPLEGLNIATFCRFVPDKKMIPRLYPELPPTEWHVEPMVSVPANSVRKVPFRVVGPPPFKLTGSPYPVDVEIRNASGDRVAGNVVNLATRYPTDRIRHTWVSDLDGSVQSCVIVPPNTKDLPDEPRGLLVSLPPSVKSPHSTARAYHPQDDRYVCVPWSRRNGVAETALGRADAMEAIAQAHRRYDIDQQRQWVSGFADAGRAAWRLAMAHPDAFTAVIPVGTDLPGDVPIDAAAGLHVMLRWGAEDPTLPGEAADRLANALRGAASVEVEVVPEQGHWWGRDTLASESINAFLTSTTPPPSGAEAAPEPPGFHRLLERPLTLVYGTGGSDAENAALRAKARFDQEQLWVAANTGARVVSDSRYDPEADPCGNVIVYGNARTHGHWDTLTGGMTPAPQGSVQVRVQPSPRCGEALVGVVSPQGPQAHRLLLVLPTTMPRGVQTEDVTIAADLAESALQITHAH